MCSIRQPGPAVAVPANGPWIMLCPEWIGAVPSAIAFLPPKP